MGVEGEAQAGPESTDRALRDFLMVLRRGLLLIVRWIEEKYGLTTE